MSATLATARLSEAETESFRREVDAIYAEVRKDLGERDRRYIRRLIQVSRGMMLAGRMTIFASLAFVESPAFLPIIVLGTSILALAKILENMEIGHNLMHGQWDWIGDPKIQSDTWEWDNVCPSALWKHSHNVVHHTWTNVVGMDHDLGYGPLRVTEQQRWHPGHLVQALYDVFLALLFEWGWAFNDVRFGRIRRGEVSREEARSQFTQIGKKAAWQLAKDYVVWPLLAGPFFLYVFVANFAANVIRNVWAHTIIFCGHFPAGVQVFTAEEVRNETRGRWYVRQVLGTCNISGGKLFHILSGNLGHQIEHHLFPRMPSNRYREIAPRVRAICERHGIPYNTAPLSRQIGTTMLKIFRLSVPSPSVTAASLRSR